MTILLKYRNSYGSVEYSPDDSCLFGKIQFISALVNYEGQTIDELETVRTGFYFSGLAPEGIRVTSTAQAVQEPTSRCRRPRQGAIRKYRDRRSKTWTCALPLQQDTDQWRRGQQITLNELTMMNC